MYVCMYACMHRYLAHNPVGGSIQTTEVVLSHIYKCCYIRIVIEYIHTYIHTYIYLLPSPQYTHTHIYNINTKYVTLIPLIS